MISAASSNTSHKLGIPVVSSKWTKTDIWEHVKLRWSIGRNKSKVKPGIYAIGNPTSDSDVFVTANYKLSFNHLRRALDGFDAWILVLDTRGINVWCAAGKGTFSTSELVKRIKWHGLEKVVNHKRLIVPQLGATGVSAHDVMKRSGFRVIFGPVLASDIKDFISNGYKATPNMRRVSFPLWERVKLIPVELAYGKYFLLIIPLFFLIISGIDSTGLSIEKVINIGGKSVLSLIVAYISGSAITPILLPYIPFKSFSLKGLFVGIISAAALFCLGVINYPLAEVVAWFLIIGGLSSFMAMNYSGSSTFTSLSGVKKEMKYALPSQIFSLSVGSLTWIAMRFI